MKNSAQPEEKIDIPQGLPAGPGSPVPGWISKSDVQSYFTNLDKNVFIFKDFKFHWKELKNHAFNSFELAMIVSKLEKIEPGLKDYDRENIKLLFEDPANPWIDQFTKNRFTFSAPELYQSLYCPVRVKLNPGMPFLKNWSHAALTKIGEFNAHHLAPCLWSFAKLSIRPDEKFISAWTKQAYRHMSSWSVEDLTRTLHSFATLGISPKAEFLTRWTEICAEILPQFNSKDISKSLWSLAVLSSYMEDDIFETLADSFFCYLDPDGISDPKSKSQINLAALQFERPDFYLETFRKDTRTEDEKRLERAYQNSDRGILLQNSYLSPLNRYADICLNDHGRQIIIECDGAYHYVRDFEGNMYTNGSTRLQNLLISKLYPHAVLIRLNYEDATYITNQFGDSGLAFALKSEFRRVHAGVYETCIENHSLALLPVLRSVSLG